MKPNDGHPEPYRYEITIKVLIAASGLHEAWPRAQEITQTTENLPHVVKATMTGPGHRPDLDGSLRVDGPPAGAESEGA